MSYEYVATKKNRGSLILSEFAGAAQSLSGKICFQLLGAFLVNPWDINSMSETIKVVLNLDLETQKAHMTKLYNYVSKYTAIFWGNHFLSTLKKTKKEVFSPNDIFTNSKSPVLGSELFIICDFISFPLKTKLYKLIKLILFRYLEKDIKLYTFSTHDAKHYGSLFSTLKSSMIQSIFESTFSVEHITKISEILLYYTDRTPGSFSEFSEDRIIWNYIESDKELAIWHASAISESLKYFSIEGWNLSVLF